MQDIVTFLNRISLRSHGDPFGLSTTKTCGVVMRSFSACLILPREMYRARKHKAICFHQGQLVHGSSTKNSRLRSRPPRPSWAKSEWSGVSGAEGVSSLQERESSHFNHSVHELFEARAGSQNLIKIKR